MRLLRMFGSEVVTIRLRYTKCWADGDVCAAALTALLGRLYRRQWGEGGAWRRMRFESAAAPYLATDVSAYFRLPPLSPCRDRAGARLRELAALLMCVLGIYRELRGHAAVTDGGRLARARGVAEAMLGDGGHEDVVRLYNDPAARACVALLRSASDGVVVEFGGMSVRIE